MILYKVEVYLYCTKTRQKIQIISKLFCLVSNFLKKFKILKLNIYFIFTILLTKITFLNA